MGATFVNITGQGYRAIVAQSESWTVVHGENGTEVYPMDSVIIPTDNDGDVQDAIVGGIAILFAFLIAAFFGFDTVANGFQVMWNSILELAGSLFFGDFKGIGIWEEDSAIIDFVFDIRETVIAIHEYVYGQYLFYFVIQD